MEPVTTAPSVAPTATERVALVAGTLLVAALTLLPWYSTGPRPTPGGAGGRTAIQAPGAAFGIGAALVAAAGLAWLAAATLLPRPPVRHPGRALLVLWAACAAHVLAKLASGLDDLASGAWAAMALVAALILTEVGASRLARRAVSRG